MSASVLSLNEPSNVGRNLKD
ncbi:hypothetical protein MED222_06135 [Vibrio sp. MED222]|nr:hypothetical protein MED222_06135 [Vibrio sp. MED222]